MPEIVAHGFVQIDASSRTNLYLDLVNSNALGETHHWGRVVGPAPVGKGVLAQNSSTGHWFRVMVTATPKGPCSVCGGKAG
jgi:hypothetical protein